MNPRERILCSFHHQTPDRTPTDGWFHPVVKKRLLSHYKTDQWDMVMKSLGIEGWVLLEAGLEFPEFRKRVVPRPGNLPGSKALWHSEDLYENEWGVKYRMVKDSKFDEWVWGPAADVQTVDEMKKIPLPGFHNIKTPENYPEQVAKLKARDLFVYGSIPNPFKRAWQVRGMETLLCDYLLNRDLLEVLFDRLYDLIDEMAVRMAKAGVDMIQFIGDIAMQDRIIMGPEAWRAVDKPRMARMIAKCKKVKPDLFFFFHSDGNMMDLMDDLVEIGVDVFNPVQPECMDPSEVKKRWGKKLILHGGIGVQTTMPFGSAEDVRNAVEDLIRNCGMDGGLVVFPSNIVQPDTSVENIQTCFHTARDFSLAK